MLSQAPTPVIFKCVKEDQKYKVPECVTKIRVHMWGAGGAGGDVSNQNAKTHGGGGGYVRGDLDVTPGEELIIIVGQGGIFGNTNSSLVIYGGGGLGGYDEGYTGTGGGRSAIRRGGDEIATAGAGGGKYGRNGSRGQGFLTAPESAGGKGGTQVSGGSGGISSTPNGSGYNGASGSQFQGGLGSNGSALEGGGGGGGYFGGGGGAGTSYGYSLGAAGGGGGSSYIGGLSNAITIKGGVGDLPDSSQQKAADDTNPYNNKLYGRGGDVSSNGQDGLVVIEVLVDNTSIVDAPSGTMTICENVAMSPIIHTTQNVNGLQSVTGLPPGLIATYASNEIVISGTPTAAGLYEYSIVPEGCGTPIQRATGTIEVVAESMAEITTPDQTICHGKKVEIGGTVNRIGDWSIELSNSSTITGTGNMSWSTIVQPSISTNYFIQSFSGTTPSVCPDLYSGSVVISLPLAGNELAKDGDEATCIVDGDDYIHFFHSSGRLIGSIHPNNQNLGEVTMKLYDEGAPLTVPACETSNLTYANTVMNRHWLVEETNPPSNAVDVRLPYYKNDFTAFKSAVNSNPNPVDIVGNQNSVWLSKYDGLNENGDASDNCNNGLTVVFNNPSAGLVAISEGFRTDIIDAIYSQYHIPGFSELWLQGETFSPLPVELTSFKAECGNIVKIQWSTASESNSDYFEIEKSRDGYSWMNVGTLEAAGSSSQSIDYSLIDEQLFGGVSYYRLKQYDVNGDSEEYGPLSVVCDGEKDFVSVYPNPSNDVFTVEINSSEDISDLQINLLDYTGRIVKQRPVQVSSGTNQFQFNISHFANGVYLLQFDGMDKIAPVKIIKE